jgi:hypothetical protein
MNVMPLRLALVLILVLFGPGMEAHARGVDGDIRGVVVDLAAAPLSDVTVTIVNTETGATRDVRTDSRGRFAAPAVAAGRYEVTAALASFAPRRQENVVVPLAQTVELRLELRPATAAETITVGEFPRVIEPSRSDVGHVVEEAALVHLPVKSRNFFDLTTTTPGVTRDLVTGAVLFMGQSGDANSATVDGGELLDFGSYQFSKEAIQEVRVNLNGYRAEYGRASGSVVEAITRSGTNRFHGSAIALRGGWLFSDDGNDTDQAGGAIGGPIARDRHFFFANADSLRRLDPDRSQRVFLIRTDHQLTGDDRVTLRFNQQSLSGHAGTTRSALGAVTTVFGSRVVNDGRVHYAQARDVLSANRLQVADTVTWAGGAPEIKTGFDAVGDDPTGGMPFDTLANTTFSTEHTSAFLQDEWRAAPAVTLNLGARHDVGSFSQWDPRMGASWRANDRVVVRGSYGRFSSPFTELRVRQASAGADYEWMPRTTIAVNYLDGRAADWDYRALTMEAQRRLWQGTQYRLAYTVSDTDSRHRIVMSYIYGTDVFADRFPDALGGIVKTVLKDWTISGILATQSMDPRIHSTRIGYLSFDPRVARNISLGSGATLAFVLESYNLRNRPNVLAVSDVLFPLRVGEREGRLTQVGVRLLF